ncbi:MAG: hypothetical protein FJ276_12610 [Planctomycetes bacterium]|nr:hypothetical protein [Planctomycetota bacterium]
MLHETDDPLAAPREAARVARARAAVIERRYREEEFGPSPAHRLAAERIRALTRTAGLAEDSRLALSHVDLHAVRPG